MNKIKTFFVKMFPTIFLVFALQPDFLFAIEQPHGNGESFSILSWNAYEMGSTTGYPFSAVRNNLLSHQPDIVTLQEVKSCSSSNGFYALLEPNQYFNHNNMWCASSNAGAGQYGIGIASLFNTMTDKFVKGLGGRTLMGAKYNILGQGVWVWSAHAGLKTQHGQTQRRNNFQDIVDYIKSVTPAGEPIILTGDFNAWRDNDRANYGRDPEDDELSILLNDGYADVFRQVYPNWQHNRLATYSANTRVDYIFTKNLPSNWEVGNLEVLANPWCTLGINNKGQGTSCNSTNIQDHSPLLMTLFIDKGNKNALLSSHTDKQALTKPLRMTGNGVFTPVNIEHENTNNTLALKSSKIENNQFVSMSTYIRRGSTLTYSLKYNTEQYKDFFEFLINGVQQQKLSGQSSWINYQFDIEDNQNKSDVVKVEWKYTKDENGSLTNEGVWLNNLNIQAIDEFKLASPQTAASAVIDTKGKQLLAGSLNDGFFITRDHSFKGEFGLQSKPIEDNQSGRISFKVLGEGSLFFTYQTSTQKGKDFLEVWVDGNNVFSDSGESSWKETEIRISGASEHEVIFKYTKDSSFAAGSDAVWIDDIKFAPYVYLQDQYASTQYDRRIAWTGAGNDCRNAGYSDCKNLILVDKAHSSGIYNASKWKLIPTEYEHVYVIQENENNLSAHGGHIYWTSGGNDCAKAGYSSNCKNLMLNSRKDLALGRNALWYFRWIESEQAYRIESREGCNSPQTCGANSSQQTLSFYWTGGGDDCNRNQYPSCKDMMLISRSNNPNENDISYWKITPQLNNGL